ncbi:MAG: hypothetical protein PHG41_07635, partial [Actinomycetota bacterium]|nr:hypothetical protein [Actinomycetota bacterium]
KYILCGSPYRRERDLRSFESLLNKGREALKEVSDMVSNGTIKNYEKIIRRAEKKLSRTNASQYFDFEYENGKFKYWEKTELIEKSYNLCGYYIL